MMNRRHEQQNISADLLPSIMARIEQERRKRCRIGIIFWACIAGASLAGMVPAFFAMEGEFARSGIPQFFSLLLSNPDAVKLFWADFVLSILGSLPAANIILVLAPALALLFSVKFLAENIAAARSSTQRTIIYG